MPKYAQLVMGPAGSGKSTYCSTMQKHGETLRRTINVVNLDPAAEYFDYNMLADIRDLISVDDAMEDSALRLGPNGGLVFCMEYFAQHFDWLQEALDDVEDDYVIFDCPGQIELYTHIPVMRQLVDQLQLWDFRVCGVFIVDAQFMIQSSKFVSGVMSALSVMVQLEIPHVNVMSKLDLLNKTAKKDLEKYLDPDMQGLLAEEFDGAASQRFTKLNQSIAGMIDDYSLVRFVPMDINEEETVNDLLIQIDMAIQYGEDLEPRIPKDEPDEDDKEGRDCDNIIDRFAGD